MEIVFPRWLLNEIPPIKATKERVQLSEAAPLPLNTPIFFKDTSGAGGTKQSDPMIGEKADFLEEVARPSPNNCQSTEQSPKQPPLPLNAVPPRLGPGAPALEKLPLFSVQPFFFPLPLKAGSIPQVPPLLRSTKPPNVLISAANAAGGQEDGGRISEGTRAAQ